MSATVAVAAFGRVRASAGGTLTRAESIPILGRNLPASKPVHIALPQYKGIGARLAEIICAKMQISKTETLQSLSEERIEQLTLFLSAPEQNQTPLRQVKLPSGLQISTEEQELLLSRKPEPPPKDPCADLILDNELVRQTRRTLNHLFKLGTRRGIRHAKGLPVHGLRKAHRGYTARKLNRLERFS